MDSIINGNVRALIVDFSGLSTFAQRPWQGRIESSV